MHMLEAFQYLASVKRLALEQPIPIYRYVDFTNENVINYATKLRKFYQDYQAYLLSFKEFLKTKDLKKINLDYDILRFVSAFETIFLKRAEFENIENDVLDNKTETLVISIGANNNSEIVFAKNPYSIIFVDKADIGFIAKGPKINHKLPFIGLLDTVLDYKTDSIPTNLVNAIRSMLKPNVNVLIIANEFIHLNPNYIKIVANIAKHIQRQHKELVKKIGILVIENDKETIDSWDRTLYRISSLYNGKLFNLKELEQVMRMLKKYLPVSKMKVADGKVGRWHKRLDLFVPGYIFGYTEVEVKT